MILGLGCDIINIERINKSEKFLEHFQHRILGNEETSCLETQKEISLEEKAAILAKYYAGKEAFAKALGTGFRDGIFLKDIQILHNELGKPILKVSAQAADYLHKLSPNAKTFISLSDDYPFAQAVVIIEE